MTFEQFVSIVRARWRISVAIFLAIVGFALIVSLLLPKQYTAVATLLVDIRASDPVDNQENPVDLQPTFVATQVEVVKSDRVARRVIQLLKLDQDPGWQKAWRKDTNGKGDFAVWAAGVFARKLAVTPSQQSTVINVSYTDSDPSGSARMADAFAQAYLDTNLELQVEPARRYAAWFSDKSNDLRANLEKAQRRLTSYQKEHGITGDDRYDVEAARLSELSNQLSLVQADEADVSSRASAAANVSPDVLQNPVVQSMREDIIQQSAKLKMLGERYGPSHPEYQEAESNLKELKAKLASEIAQVSSSMKVASQTSADRAAKLRAAIEEQRQKVLDLASKRNRLEVLQRDVESAQKAYDMVAQRFSQTNLQSELKQTNVTILSRASAPLTPSKPKIVLNLILATFVGLVVGVGGALLMEIFDRTIRSTTDLSMNFGLAVLASFEGARPRSVWERMLGAFKRSRFAT
jgi:chain length determinant protein EpsF